MSQVKNKRSKPKNKQKIVTKPILIGSIIDKTSSKRAWRVVGAVLISMFIYLVFGTMLVIENTFFRIIMNAALLIICAGFLYMTGSTHGEADAAFSEIMYERTQEGKPIDPADKARCYNLFKGFYTAALGALPFFILALILAVTTQERYYSLGVLPSWVSAYERQSEIGNALAYYHREISVTFQSILTLVVRLLIFPFISMAGDGVSAVLLERLSPLLVLFVPLGYPLGYLRGRQVRAQIHTNIAANTRKKKKKDRQERQRRAREPEQLV